MAGELWALFGASLLGATLLPGGSEILLYVLLSAEPWLWPAAILAAGSGNTLGGMLTYYLGRLLPPGNIPPQLQRMRRYGSPALLFAWAPVVGDGLLVAAGWLRLRWAVVLIYSATGRFLRYGVVALAAVV